MGALVGILNAVQVGQFLVGQKSLGDSRVEAPCYAAALSWLVLKSNFDSVHSHGSGSTPAAEVVVELPHGLLDQKISVSINLVKTQRSFLFLNLSLTRSFWPCLQTKKIPIRLHRKV